MELAESGFELILLAVQECDVAMDMAAVDFYKALPLARVVSDPWYRCQALAGVARFAPDDRVVDVADEAYAAAKGGRNAYKISAAAAWPIRALVERGKISEAQRMLAQSLEEAGRIEQPVSKVDALELLLHATWFGSGDTRLAALEALIAACQSANSWKAGRCLRDTALLLASEDKAYAQRIVQSMPQGIYKRQAQRQFDAGEIGRVRTFFWR